MLLVERCANPLLDLGHPTGFVARALNASAVVVLWFCMANQQTTALLLLGFFAARCALAPFPWGQPRRGPPRQAGHRAAHVARGRAPVRRRRAQVCRGRRRRHGAAVTLACGRARFGGGGGGGGRGVRVWCGEQHWATASPHNTMIVPVHVAHHASQWHVCGARRVAGPLRDRGGRVGPQHGGRRAAAALVGRLPRDGRAAARQGGARARAPRARAPRARRVRAARAAPRARDRAADRRRAHHHGQLRRRAATVSRGRGGGLLVARQRVQVARASAALARGCQNTKEARHVWTVPLSALLGRLPAHARATLLKIDAQGYDLNVVASAGDALDRIDYVAMEVVSDDCAALYDGPAQVRGGGGDDDQARLRAARPGAVHADLFARAVQPLLRAGARLPSERTDAPRLGAARRCTSCTTCTTTGCEALHASDGAKAAGIPPRHRDRVGKRLDQALHGRWHWPVKQHVLWKTVLLPRRVRHAQGGRGARRQRPRHRARGERFF